MNYAKILVPGLFFALGCTTGMGPDGPLDNDPPLANVDELLEGAPKADEIERGLRQTGICQPNSLSFGR